MLRKIRDDIRAKNYTQHAKEVAHYRVDLKDIVDKIVCERDGKLMGTVRSVMQTGSTVIVRASSRAAMSELYMFREKIMKALHRAGVFSVRFSV